MKEMVTRFPSLTADDIRTLKGEPMGKRVEYSGNSYLEESEEWIYYDTVTNTRECYTFKNQKLIDYKSL